MQAWGKFMIVRYLDPWGRVQILGFRVRVWSSEVQVQGYSYRF